MPKDKNITAVGIRRAVEAARFVVPLMVQAEFLAEEQPTKAKRKAAEPKPQRKKAA